MKCNFAYWARTTRFTQLCAGSRCPKNLKCENITRYFGRLSQTIAPKSTAPLLAQLFFIIQLNKLLICIVVVKLLNISTVKVKFMKMYGFKKEALRFVAFMKLVSRKDSEV